MINQITMTNENKIDNGKFIIQRFDDSFNAINTKATFYIALSTFLFGGICTGYVSLYGKITPGIEVYAFTIFHMLCSIGSILYTLFAMTPFTKHSYAYSNYTSLLFYGGIAKHTCADFQQKFLKQDEAILLEDMTEQIHCLANGLDKKFKRLKITSRFLFVQFVLLLPFFYIIFKNLHS